MKHNLLLVLALSASAPAMANFSIDFENTWNYSNGDIVDYYNGGAAADGSTGGPNEGVSFVNVSGLSNDALGPYYSNAPSPLGVAYAHDTAYLDVAAGADHLSFSYSSTAAGTIAAYSGLNGGGTLLGTFDLVNTNNVGAYDTWIAANFTFSGTAQSFDLSNTSGVVFDNVAAVPLPAASWLLGAGLGLVGLVSRRNKVNG